MTLTSEWETYRWGPVSTRDPETGLMDEQGFFHKRSEGVWANANPEAATHELEVQIQRALQAGMNLTHIDTHMGSVAHPAIIPGYVQLAVKYGLPLMLPRMTAEDFAARKDVDNQAAEMAVGLINTLEEMGIPLVDGLSGLELEVAADRFEQAKQALRALKPGITHFIIHPSKDTPELRHITTSWDCRVADYETFMSEDTREFIENEGIHVIGYRALKEIMPPAP